MAHYSDEQVARGMRKLARFHEWRYQNPQAWAYGVRHALKCAEGGQHVSGSAVVESICELDFTDAHGLPTKTNNDYAPIIARVLIITYPELRGRVELRKSVFDVLMPLDGTAPEGGDESDAQGGVAHA